MKLFSRDNLQELQQTSEGPCISIYQPTHRHHPDNVQDPIRFKNLIKEVEDSMLLKFSKEEISVLTEPLHELAGDAKFWNYTADSIAVFVSKNM